MALFEFSGAHDPIREDLVSAYRGAWDHIARPGTWLTGAQRVAVAAETRRARDCSLCAERKAALSPFAVEGNHAAAGALSAALVDAVHRVTTDAARLTEAWYRSLRAASVTPQEYVEALGVAVIAISVDRFHDALGLPLEVLPEALPGEPTREKPAGTTEGEAWVPMLGAKQTSAAIGLGALPAPYVIRALSLVPAEVRAWRDVSAVQYLGEEDIVRFDTVRAASRSQIELVAGRVSALNECFY